MKGTFCPRSRERLRRGQRAAGESEDEDGAREHAEHPAAGR